MIDSWTIIDDSNGNWPEGGRTRYLEIERPKNCHTTLEIKIMDGEDVLTGVSRKSISSPTSEGTYKVPIRAANIPDDVDEIQVRLEWKNAIKAIEGVVTIQRPN